MGESNVQIIYKVAIKGGRLPLPPADGSPFIASAPSVRSASSAGSSSSYPSQALVVPAAIRDLMAACFAHQPAERPDTHTAVCVIDTVLMELDRGNLVVEQNGGGGGGGKGGVGGDSKGGVGGDSKGDVGGSSAVGAGSGVAGGADVGKGDAAGNRGTGLSWNGASAGPSNAVGAAAESAEPRRPESSGADAMMAVGNQPQLATPFSNLDFLMD
ncbi:hypothetical protein PLESTB_001052500 [Pleodorina starrii]|uniref:Protein kinase domain-containing protein n=1 Tax=Pleodorina starrii TaxID=330485 RepID=A0A9W6BQ88_9CHLO|nr:hypothetical protein PLESTB_001052500 [Pleodorina starrii]